MTNPAPKRITNAPVKSNPKAAPSKTAPPATPQKPKRIK